MKKFTYLDSVRGLACLMVVFSHCTLTFFPYIHNLENAVIPEANYFQGFLNQSIFGVTYSGTAAVYIFFVLSGIVLSYSFEKKLHPNMLKLFIARYFRLMIPALASCIIALIVYLTFSNSINNNTTLPDWIRSIAISNPKFSDAIYNGTISPFIFQKSSYNVVLWTMGIEFFGSILVYSFCALERKLSTLTCLALSAATIAIVSYFDPRMSFGLTCFMIGLGIFKWEIRIDNKWIAWLVLFLGLYLAGVHNNSKYYSVFSAIFSHYSFLLINILSAPVIVLGIMSLSKAQKWLDQPFLVELGRRSFPIYLIHLPILLVVVGLGEQITGFEQHYNEKGLALSALVVLLSITLSKLLVRVDNSAIFISKKIHQ